MSNKTQANIDFSSDQWRFIAARLESGSDKEAAEKIGLKPQTVSAWKNKRAINEYIADARQTAAIGVRDSIEAHSVKAVMTMIKLLDSDDETIRFRFGSIGD